MSLSQRSLRSSFASGAVTMVVVAEMTYPSVFNRRIEDCSLGIKFVIDKLSNASHNSLKSHTIWRGK